MSEQGGGVRHSSLGRTRLQTLAQIRDEMARVYRACVTGKVTRENGNAYVFQLHALAKVTETVVLEQQLEALEDRTAGINR